MTLRYEGPAVFLMGPTAAGKTDTAIRIAGQVPTHIISVDSALVYRGMNIGTAKPAAALRARFPHALVDIREPHQPYSAAEFCSDALLEIEYARAAGRIPLLVGGTMLYYRALRDGLAELPAADPDIRANIEALAEAQGWPVVHARLRAVDPVTAERLKPTDSQRLQRALEVHELTGVPLSDWHSQQTGTGLRDEALQFGMMPDERSWLHRRIDLRLDAMLQEGFADEVKALHARTELHPGLPAMRCVGYRQLWQWLDGEMDFARACEAARAATRQLAKRQLTWLRSWPGLRRLPISDLYGPAECASAVLAALPPDALRANEK